MEEQIFLTSYSKGAGCGCKIAPNVLQEILSSQKDNVVYPKLIIGNDTNDDAAVYDLDNGMSVISTTDFFMPIVDDPFDFGRIAAANAISDVYAMGGNPLMAIAVLGWPVEKLPPSVASLVLNGARKICNEAGIPLAGGHSIDSVEPIFGLSVTGQIPTDSIKRNDGAKEGDWLFLTKPIGVGILSTAQKRGQIAPEHVQVMIDNMTKLNKIGADLGSMSSVNAVTDVTGFGLLGHAIEMAEGSGLSLELYYHKIQVVSGAKEYLALRIVPDATYRNWNSYSAVTSFEKGVNVMEAFNLLPDPQTNGGLLISVHPDGVEQLQALLQTNGYEGHLEPIGRFLPKGEKYVHVLP